MSKQSFNTGQVLTAAQVNSLQANDFNQTVSVKTANYTLAAADKGTRIEFNTSGSVTCTVNSGLFDAGDTLVIQNRGAGTATITAGTATVNTSASLALAQYSAGTLYFVSDSAALFFGDAAGISASIIDAAGDLIYGTAADTVARLGIGTAGQVLKVNSGATAPEWGAAASGSTFVGCALYSASSQTISNSVQTAVTWDSERFDTDGFHSTSTNTSRITIPTGKGGKYLFVWNHHWHGSATGERYTQLYKNGSGTGMIDGGKRNNFNVNAGNTQGAAQIVDATAGDYFEVFAQQTSGGNLGVTVANEYNQFSCVYLGA